MQYKAVRGFKDILPDQVGTWRRFEQEAKRIFELFQRAVGRDIEGTGAGLAIVQQVARRHGGRAWVRPRKGGGSEFIITFGT